MILGQGHDTPLGHGQQLCEILSRSHLAARSYGPDTDFQYMCTVTLNLEDTLLGHGQHLCEILSNLAVRSYGPGTDFQYVCTVTLTLEIWPWVNVMTHPWVMDNNCVKLYPDWTREYEVMARTRCEQTDRQTDRQGDSDIPPYFVCGGYNYGQTDRQTNKPNARCLHQTFLTRGIKMVRQKLQCSHHATKEHKDALLCASNTHSNSSPFLTQPDMYAGFESVVVKQDGIQSMLLSMLL